MHISCSVTRGITVRLIGPCLQLLCAVPANGGLRAPSKAYARHISARTHPSLQDVQPQCESHCKWHLQDIKQSSTQLRSRDGVFPKVVFRDMLQKSDVLMFVSDSPALARTNAPKLSLSLSMKRGEIAWTANRQ
jgi:hypothetical protein